MNKDYLGDGVYIEYDGHQIRLFASNGIFDTNQIFMEPAVLNSFLRYIEQLKIEHGDRLK